MNRELAQGKRYKKGRGQSLVEFALVLPLLALIVLGALDLGRAFFTLIVITNAAREGARYGTIWFDDDYSNNIIGIKNSAIRDASQSGVSLSSTGVSCSRDVNFANEFLCDTGDVDISGTDRQVEGSYDSKCDRGQPITVSVTYSFSPVLGLILGSSIDMTREVEMFVP